MKDGHEVATLDAPEAGKVNVEDSWVCRFIQETQAHVVPLLVTAAGVAVAAAAGYAAYRFLPLGTRNIANQCAARLSAASVRIVPLSESNLPGAIKASQEGFRYGYPWLNPKADFVRSLNPVLNAKAPASKFGEMNARYFVAVDAENKVLGTTGLYQIPNDCKDSLWLGWMSVRPAYRGMGVGQKLLDFSIDQAKKDGASFLKLYTTNCKSERAAQALYEKAGLRVVGVEPYSLPIPGMKYLFRELKF